MQIFDPIRVFMVEGKLEDWFDVRRKLQLCPRYLHLLLLLIMAPYKIEYKLYKWIRSNTVDYFYNDPQKDASSYTGSMRAWQERQDAEGAVGRYLSDLPSKH